MGIRTLISSTALLFLTSTLSDPGASAVSLLPEGELADRLGAALKVLRSVPTGRSLLERGRKRFHLADTASLRRLFKWSDVSRTDAVLTRHYDPGSQTEVRERLVTVYLKKNQSFDDLVLDVAHEMTHAAGEPNWDPYDPHLTAVRYIRASLEGPGGEVDALANECRVSLELSARYGTSAHRCERYRLGHSQNQVDRVKIRKDFYRMGAFHKEILQALGSEAASFPDLSTESPTLFSSTGNAPYPLALLREFQEINGVACSNTRRRLSLVAQNSGRSDPSRSPASEGALGSQPTSAPSDAKTETFLKLRCTQD